MYILYYIILYVIYYMLYIYIYIYVLWEIVTLYFEKQELFQKNCFRVQYMQLSKEYSPYGFYRQGCENI